MKYKYPLSMPEVVEDMEHPEVYDIDWFIFKFSQIPEDRFWRGKFRHDEGRYLRCCAMGLCGTYLSDSSQDQKTKWDEMFVRFTEEAIALREIPKKIRYGLSIYDVNDNRFGGYSNIDDPDLEEIFALNSVKGRILKMLEIAKNLETEINR